MAKTNTTIDEDLYSGLQQARKKKPQYYCLVIKGQEVLKLIVQKKKINEGTMNKAKSEFQGNAIISGVVVGEGNELGFQVLEEEPSLKTVNVRDFISEKAELNCKPRWVVVKELAVVPDDETGAPTQPKAGGETPEKETEETAPTKEDEFAIRAREQIAVREKTIKAGIDWATKNASPQAEAIAKAYESAGEKLKSAKTESDFDGAVQAHDDVIALIRQAMQDAKGPAKEPGDKKPVRDEKSFQRHLTQAAKRIQNLLKSKYADQGEVQKMVALTKLVDSQVKNKEYEQADIVLEKLEKGLSEILKNARESYQQAKNEFEEHPDRKYINQTIQAVWAWRGFDVAQKKAGLMAIAANNKLTGFGEDFEEGVKLRNLAVTECKAWDVEVERVAKAKERHDLAYNPHKNTIETADKLSRKKGLPSPVAVIAKEYGEHLYDWNGKFRYDAFDEAIPFVKPLAEVSQRLIDEEKSYREAKERFDLVNKPLAADVKTAREFAQLLAQRKLNVGATKKLCDDLETARNKVDEKLKIFEYDNAIPLVAAVKSAAEELLKFKTKYENDKQTALSGWNNLKADLATARKMPANHPTFSGDRQAMQDSADRFADIYNKNYDYPAALLEFDTLEKAVAKVKSAYEQMQVEKGEFDNDWNPHVSDYAAVKNLGERDKKVKPLVDALKKAWDELCVPYGVYDYVAAKALIPAVASAITPLLTERPKQEAEWNKALKKVQKIHKKWQSVPRVGDEVKRLSKICFDLWWEADKLAKAGDFLGGKAKLTDFVKAYDNFAKGVVAHDKVAGPKAKEARQEVEKLVKKGELKGKSVAEKKDLLEKLRGATTMGKDERKAMREIYNSLELDPEFLEEDKKRRNVIVGKLTNSKAKKEELTDFRDNWTKKTKEEKIAIVEKALKAQCEAMGFGDNPPKIIEFDKKPTKGLTTNGYFDPNDGNIYLNINPAASLARDLESTLDLIFHENSHNYQDKLVKKFNNGEIDPLDPEYKQAELFAMNVGSHSYVKGEENFQDYKKQPLEEHAHDNGPKTAKAVLKDL